MLAFYKEDSGFLIVPTPLGQLADSPEKDVIDDLHECVLPLPWAQNVALLTVKNREQRLWYMMHAISKGWTHDTFCAQIKTNLYERQGIAKGLTFSAGFQTHD